ncbi:hypothetical protein KC220_26760, partial [Mycobacterium tuberculosis]|nr:hypothetical protein [Mycobacterium tuberculosis]
IAVSGSPHGRIVPVALLGFHILAIRIKWLKGSYYPYLLNNYLNFSGLAKRKPRGWAWRSEFRGM